MKHTLKNLIQNPAQNTDVRPFLVIWEMPMACDLACPHCRAEAIVRHDPKCLTTDAGKKFFLGGVLPLSAGNVRQNSLVDIYQNIPSFCQLRPPDTFNGGYGQCEFQTVCGGSRARAYTIHDHARGEKPFCIYEPHSFPYQAQVATYVGEG